LGSLVERLLLFQLFRYESDPAEDGGHHGSPACAEESSWIPEPGHPWSKELWAPELHRWGDKWYIYFAADASDNASHRIYVVENDNDDLIEGKGKISDPSNQWAIDPSTFELRGQPL
jgi:GH43 family beta-xylosidase